MERVGPAHAGRLCLLLFAPAAIASAIVLGEADPPVKGIRVAR